MHRIIIRIVSIKIQTIGYSIALVKPRRPKYGPLFLCKYGDVYEKCNKIDDK